MYTSPAAETLLLHEVGSRLRYAIPTSVQKVGTDDDDELLQDGLVIALCMLHAAGNSGKKPTAGNLAYYTLKHLRAGRRSTGCHKNDPLHPAAQLTGRCRVHSMEEPVSSNDSGDESLTLGDVLESRADDPAVEAGRRMDWAQLVQKLDRAARAVLLCLANGRDLTTLVSRLHRSRTSLQNDKERLARIVREILGADILVLAVERAGWRSNLDAYREKQACRWERQAV